MIKPIVGLLFVSWLLVACSSDDGGSGAGKDDAGSGGAAGAGGATTGGTGGSGGTSGSGGTGGTGGTGVTGGSGGSSGSSGSGNQGGSSGGAPTGGYTLADATAGLPFTVDTPTAPQGTLTEVAVTPATFNANNVNGRRLILGAGDYGSITIGGTDKEIVLTTAVIVNVLFINGQRIVVRANPVRTGTINYFVMSYTGSDILFDGIRTESTSLSDERNVVGGSRIAIINSRLRTRDYVLNSFPGAGQAVEDIIVGNNYLESFNGQQAALRLHSNVRLAFVDNLMWSSGGNATFRLHTSHVKSDNLYVGRNQFQGPFWQIRPLALGTGDPNTTPGMGSVWVEDNTVYYTGLWWINMGLTSNNVDHPEVFTQRNNNAYIGSGGWKANDYGAAWTYVSENNTVQGYVAPPAWEHQ